MDANGFETTNERIDRQIRLGDTAYILRALMGADNKPQGYYVIRGKVVHKELHEYTPDDDRGSYCTISLGGNTELCEMENVPAEVISQCNLHRDMGYFTDGLFAIDVCKQKMALLPKQQSV